MPKDAHNKAAEHHENAAKSHKMAAEHHGKGDHQKGREESARAQTHSKTAREHSDMAHSKSHDGEVTQGARRGLRRAVSPSCRCVWAGARWARNSPEADQDSSRCREGAR